MNTEPGSTGQMSTTPPPPTPAYQTGAATTEVRGRSDDSFGWRERMRETKPSFATTEFWAMILGLAAVVVIYNVSDDASLDLWRACLLGTIIGTAYIVSRGLAKSGSHDSRRARDDANRY